MNTIDPLKHRLLALAEPVLSDIPGALEQFQAEAQSGELSLRLGLLYGRDPLPTASRYDDKFESWIAEWVRKFRPVGRATGDASNTGTPKRWTVEEREKLRAYRDAHTAVDTAKNFGISTARVRHLLSAKTPEANPFGGLGGWAK